jgi:hypothetical protein
LWAYVKTISFPEGLTDFILNFRLGKIKKYEEASGSKDRQEQKDVSPASASGFQIPGYVFASPGFDFPHQNLYPGPNYNSGDFRPPM